MAGLEQAAALVLDLESVRIIGFDAGHGGCNIFDARKGNVIQARDSDFIGGYGKAPGLGYLFSSGQSILARFTNCHLELLGIEFKKDSQKGHILFQNCTFSLFKKNPLLEPMANIEFSGCKFENLWDPKIPQSKLQKDLGDLFLQLKE